MEMSHKYKVLTLYSTSACHLCEQAIRLLKSISELAEITVVITDISDSVELVERYGIRIPVLAVESQDSELAWPFNSADVKHFLHNAGLI